MTMNRSIGAIILGLATFAAAGPDEGEVAARQSLKVQARGPQLRIGSDRFFDVEGPAIPGAGDYSAFGLLDFPAPKDGQEPASLTLALTQRVEDYTLDGRIKFYLVADVAGDLPAFAKEFKYDLGSPDGVAGQVNKKVAVGTGLFTRKLAGEVDRFPLDLGAEARAVLGAQIKAGTIRVLIVPDDPKVVATFSGAGPNSPKERRPRLILGPQAP